MAEVSLREVWKIYGKQVEAVKGLSLDIKNGEFVSLLGPSGCGKSSTLRMVAGLEEITRGELHIGNKLVNHLEPSHRDVAMVFENYALLPHLTAYDNIAFPLLIRKEKRNVIDKKVREISHLLDLDKLLGELAVALGGGERQRVGIARALIRNASLLLMDEPISHLDAALRSKTRGELARLQKILGVTTLYVTHDQSEALAMSDRIAVMNYGELQQYGTPEELYYHPDNLFVAHFIGEPPMNFVPCILQHKGDKIRLYTEKQGLDVTFETAEAEGRINPGFQEGAVWLGVRPRDVLLTSEGEKNAIKGGVESFEPGCEYSTMEVRVGDGSILMQCSPDFFFNEGEAIYLDLIAKQFHLFDAKTEMSILQERGK